MGGLGPWSIGDDSLSWHNCMTAHVLPIPAANGSSLPMVGRESEFVLLQEQLAEVERGSGRLAIIGGEAGIGKTMLSRHLAEAGRGRGFRILAGGSYDLMSASP